MRAETYCARLERALVFRIERQVLTNYSYIKVFYWIMMFPSR